MHYKWPSDTASAWVLRFALRAVRIDRAPHHGVAHGVVGVARKCHGTCQALPKRYTISSCVGALVAAPYHNTIRLCALAPNGTHDTATKKSTARVAWLESFYFECLAVAEPHRQPRRPCNPGLCRGSPYRSGKCMLTLEPNPDVQQTLGGRAHAGQHVCAAMSALIEPPSKDPRPLARVVGVHAAVPWQTLDVCLGG